MDFKSIQSTYLEAYKEKMKKIDDLINKTITPENIKKAMTTEDSLSLVYGGADEFYITHEFFEYDGKYAMEKLQSYGYICRINTDKGGETNLFFKIPKTINDNISHGMDELKKEIQLKNKMITINDIVLDNISHNMDELKNIAEKMNKEIQLQDKMLTEMEAKKINNHSNHNK